MNGCAICTPKSLPHDKREQAAQRAIQINPMNAAPVHRLKALIPDGLPATAYISVLTNKYWHTKGVRLTVGFLDGPAADLRARILSHMNAWSTRLNVSFVESAVDPQVRIARTVNDGYWSYLGTDILSIPADQPTMNLESFTMNTAESEFRRVIRHETGHTLGCPHEHMRKELVDKIDRQKAIAYFGATQGWSEQEVEAQVLTPIEAGSLWGTTHADPVSIMCYQIPGTITVDGQPIPGGIDIDDSDFTFMESVYPKSDAILPTSQATAPEQRAAAPGTDPQIAQLREEVAVLRKAIAILARDQ